MALNDVMCSSCLHQLYNTIWRWSNGTLSTQLHDVENHAFYMWGSQREGVGFWSKREVFTQGRNLRAPYVPNKLINLGLWCQF
jgi:hypothetical protein